jgi:DNA invertase Pin-like site-specific DNA recombinase
MRIRRIEATARQRRLRVAAYCRVSTKLTEQEESLEVQQSVYERYIRSNTAWEFAGLYADARSGLNASRREGFMKMIADARAGKIDLILCKSISRFSRNIVECQRYVELLRSRNVAVLFEKEHIRTDEPTSNLVFSLMCAVALDYSQ